MSSCRPMVSPAAPAPESARSSRSARGSPSAHWRTRSFPGGPASSETWRSPSINSTASRPAEAAAMARTGRDWPAIRSPASAREPSRPEQLVGAREGFEGAGVGPPAGQHVERQVAARDVGVVDVGDLQLAARRRFQARDHVMDGLVVEVDAGDSEPALRLLRLLDDADDAVARDLGDAVAARVVDLLDQDLGAARLLAVRLRERRDRFFEDVVAQDHGQPPAAPEAPRQPQRLCDAARLVLHTVGELAAEVLTAAEQTDDVAHVLGSGHDQDLADAGLDQLLDRVEDHGYAPDLQEMLVRHLGQREEARSGPPGQDDPAQLVRAHRLAPAPVASRTAYWRS